MKKWILYLVIGLICSIISYTALQSFVRGMIGIYNDIPSVQHFEFYQNHLRNGIRDIDGMDQDQVRQLLKENLVYQLKFADRFQPFLKKLEDHNQIG